MKAYIEVGQKKSFANAIDWPGWGRSGRTPADALAALAAYGPRYAAAIAPAGLGFAPPADVSGLVVTKEVEGNASTDFGTFGVIPTEDTLPLDERDVQRFQALLQACWQALERAANAAAGRELRKGPRGGGRDLDGVLGHVLASQAAYLGRMGVKFKPDPSAALQPELRRCAQAALDGLAASARGDLPAQGPRGGVYWPARYFVRSAAWHVLDHAWEIEDRVI